MSDSIDVRKLVCGMVRITWPSGKTLVIGDEFDPLKKADDNPSDTITPLFGIERMTLNEYQSQAASTAVYPDRGRNFTYTALGLAGEAGEVANKAKKVIRDDSGVITKERSRQLIKELGGVLWYVSLCAKELGESLEHIARVNLDELASRAERGTIQGSGDDR